MSDVNCSGYLILCILAVVAAIEAVNIKVFPSSQVFMLKFTEINTFFKSKILPKH